MEIQMISPCKNTIFKSTKKKKKKKKKRKKKKKEKKKKKKKKKKNQNPWKDHNSGTDLKFQHKPKYHHSKILI
jgi:hypothetical protein